MFFNKPQRDLQQFLDTPFYLTPDDPADPTDCDRYPDSPYCGKNPLNFRFNDLSPTIVADKCNLGIQINGTLGFIRLPPTQIAYRFEDCRKTPKAPPPLKLENYETPVFVPSGGGYGLVFLEHYFDYEDGKLANAPGQQPGAYARAEIFQSLLNYQIQKGDEFLGTIDGTPFVAYCRFNFHVTRKRNSNWMYRYRVGSVGEWEVLGERYRDAGWNVPGNYLEEGNALWTLNLSGEVSLYFTTYSSSDYYITKCSIPDVYAGTDYFPPSITPLETLRNFPPKNIQSFYTYEAEYETERIFDDTTIISDFQPRQLERARRLAYFFGQPYYYHVYTTSPIELQRREYVINPLPFQAPPPPPYDHCCKNMACCPDNSNLEALLRLILKRIGEPKEITIFDEDLDRKGSQKAKKKPPSLNDFLKLTVERVEIANRVLGIENFPVSVPDTMLNPYQEGLFAKMFGFIDGKKERKIKSVTEFIAWMAEQDSAVLGQFHQVIEYETGNKDKKGKPEKSTVVLPNVAETLKEITLLVAQMAKQNNAQTAMITAALTEIVATRAVATKGTAISQDIQDYLDYPTETKTNSFQANINLPKYKTKDGIPIATGETEDFKEFLKPGTISYSYDDWTGDNSLHDQLVDLLQLASILRAIFYQRIDK